MTRKIGFISAIIALACIALFWGTRPQPAPIAAAPQCQMVDRAQLNALAVGEIAGLKVLDVPRLLPALAFEDATGAPISLANFKGKAVLMNFWATWCAPCREEMPALDALQSTFNPQHAQVVAISMDVGGIDKPKKFLDEIRATRLTLYADPKGQMIKQLKALGRGTGLPTTLLIDKNGCEQGFLLGAANWNNENMQKIIKLFE